MSYWRITIAAIIALVAGVVLGVVLLKLLGYVLRWLNISDSNNMIAVIGITSGAAVSVVMVIMQMAHENRKFADREIYQALEMASIDLFRFEADHVDLIRPLWEKNTPVPPRDSAEHVAFMNYVCQILNLFEMAIRFRSANIMSPAVFGSWVVWYHSVARAPHFAEVWKDVKYGYTIELRDIMDKGVELCQALSPEGGRRRFFEFAGDKLDCDEIRHWIDRVDGAR